MTQHDDDPKVAIVADNASVRMGGEACLAVHHFGGLRTMGVEAYLITHDRSREELLEQFPDDRDRLLFIPDTWLMRLLSRIGGRFPRRIDQMVFGYLIGVFQQFAARRIVRDLVQAGKVSVVHLPVPVSPKMALIDFCVGVPVVIGPLNGGMSYPPGFRWMQSRLVTATIGLGRSAANLVNRLLPGKRRADTILFANQRTREALPSGLKGKILELVENGIDPELWQPVDWASRDATAPLRFVFVGRLEPLKGVDMLFEAFKPLADSGHTRLVIIGEGDIKPELIANTQQLGLEDAVEFVGWLTQEECAEQLRQSDGLILPSLLDCGGAVVLEAMAVGLPVIATDWGGPADYIDSSCGILVEPTSKAAFVAGLTAAMTELADSFSRRRTLGEAGRAKVLAQFGWPDKIKLMIEIHRDAIRRANSNA